MIRFRYDDNITAVIYKTSVQLLPDLCEAFERFLLACGYVLPKGAHIGYEYDDETVKEEKE